MDDLKERPILFSGAMVRAILSGQKTVTRRVVHWRGEGEALVMPSRDGQPQWPYARRNGNETPLRCPYGAPGDRLWVRETWRYESDGVAMYRADVRDELAHRAKWRPGIHLRREHARLFLAVESVRVERIHMIDCEDARREGIGSGPWADERDGFARLWQKINGKRAPWSADPWVWRVQFRRLP